MSGSRIRFFFTGESKAGSSRDSDTDPNLGNPWRCTFNAVHMYSFKPDLVPDTVENVPVREYPDV